MSYEPHPSTLGYRAIQYLKTLPKDKWIASKPLAQALETDTTTLVSCLITVVKHGLVLREKRNGFWWFALGNDKTQKDAEVQERSAKADENRPRAEPLDMDKIHRLAEQNNPFSGAVPKEDPKPPAPEPEPGELPDKVDDGTNWGGPALPPSPDLVPTKDPEPEPVAPAVAPAQDDPFRYSWCSDDVMTISKGGQSVSMGPDEYGKLAWFVELIEMAKVKL